MGLDIDLHGFKIITMASQNIFTFMKKVIIKLQSAKRTLDQFEKTYKDLTLGKKQKSFKPSGDVVLYFENLGVVAKVFTEARLEIISAIKAHKPKSINSLAKLLNRSQPNVHRDVQYLASLGVITLKQSKTKNPKKSGDVEPSFNYSSLELDLAA